MPIPGVNLDDRTFEQLLSSAIERARSTSPDWRDMSPSDPGRVMLELFAYLTETMIFRLNRLPEKVYVELLRLLGVTLKSPSAARVEVVFSVDEPPDTAVVIPEGTQMSATGGQGDELPVFTTIEDATLAAGAREVRVQAYHVSVVQAELVGHGTGATGMTVSVVRAPIVARSADDPGLTVAVEVVGDEIDTDSPMLQQGDRVFRVWQEVSNFTEFREDRHVYVCDRLAGKIHFAPAARLTSADGEFALHASAMGAVPAEGREIRVWYRTGGGASGNVGEDRVTELLGKLDAAFTLTNPKPAWGGSDVEAFDNALLRGPEELHSLQRAVTARDFELHALRASAAVNRAYAYSKHQRWRFAPRGTVEVLIVPDVDDEQIVDHVLSKEHIEAHQDEAIAEAVRSDLNKRRPLGTQCSVNFAHVKSVAVRAKLTVYREEDPATVEKRVVQRLHRTINPLHRGVAQQGWPFGQELNIYQVYQILSEEPGVKNVDPPVLEVASVPDADVVEVGADAYQPHVWYAAAANRVFRTVNDADGWENIKEFDDEQVKFLRPYPEEAAAHRDRAGLIAVVTEPGAGDDSRIYVSRDCGESFESLLRPQMRVDDIAWYESDNGPSLLLATEKGLWRLDTDASSSPVPMQFEQADSTLGVYAVAVSMDVWGGTSIIVASHERKGVYLSVDEGRSFKNIGLTGSEIRTLAVEHIGRDRYLWAGVTVIGDEAGEGAKRWQLTGTHESPDGWKGFINGWIGGSCVTLAFHDGRIFAGSQSRGVLTLDVERDGEWHASDVHCGLPIAELNRMHAIDDIAVGEGVIMVATPVGVYRSIDNGETFDGCSNKEFPDRVTLPQTWTLCSGDHEIEVVNEDGS